MDCDTMIIINDKTRNSPVHVKNPAPNISQFVYDNYRTLSKSSMSPKDENCMISMPFEYFFFCSLCIKIKSCFVSQQCYTTISLGQMLKSYMFFTSTIVIAVFLGVLMTGSKGWLVHGQSNRQNTLTQNIRLSKSCQRCFHHDDFMVVNHKGVKATTFNNHKVVTL